MHITVTSQPDPLVTLDEAKVALGESGNDRNDLIISLIFAAQAELDGPKGWVGITVARQTVAVTLDEFCDSTQLPGGPIIGPVIVDYLDGDGEAQTLSEDTYVLLSSGRVVLVPDYSWPTTYDRSESVTFTYEAGIEDDGDPRIGLMKAAILLHVRMTLDGVDLAASRRAIESLVRSMWVPVL